MFMFLSSKKTPLIESFTTVSNGGCSIINTWTFIISFFHFPFLKGSQKKLTIKSELLRRHRSACTLKVTPDHRSDGSLIFILRSLKKHLLLSFKITTQSIKP